MKTASLIDNQITLSFKNDVVVSHTEIYPLVRIIWNLAKIHTNVVLATGLVSNIGVKGKNEIIDALSVVHLTVSKILAKKYDKIQNMPNEIKSWLDILEREYGDPTSIVFAKPLYLSRKHATKLQEDIIKWFEELYSIYEKPNTKLLNQKELHVMLDNLSKILEDEEKEDLKDGFECIMNNIPTPAVMILHRVGESVVKKFYKKEMEKDPPENSTMGFMAQELREKQRKEIESSKRDKPDPLVHYILSQTDERNLAQHPGRRYIQTEAEEVFIFVKKLINDIHERLEK